MISIITLMIFLYWSSYNITRFIWPERKKIYFWGSFHWQWNRCIRILYGNPILPLPPCLDFFGIKWKWSAKLGDSPSLPLSKNQFRLKGQFNLHLFFSSCSSTSEFLEELIIWLDQKNNHSKNLSLRINGVNANKMY